MRETASGITTIGFDTEFLCKLCRSPSERRRYVLQRPWKNTVPYLVATCAGCGLLQNVYDWRHALQVQGEERENMVHRGAHELWDSADEIDANRDKAAGFAEALDRLGMIKGKRILEVGCGKGIFIRRCLDLGAASVTGQEFFTKDSLDYARDQLGIDDLRTVGFEDTGAWPDGEFDLVCSFDVAEHVHDLREFFRQTIRVTAPGGLQYHATPGSGSLSNRVGRLLVGPLGSVSKARNLGTLMVNLQPDLDHRGGAHVSLLGTAQVRWLAAHFGLTLLQCGYASSYTYSNRHYAALILGLRRLPAPVGATAFGLVRKTIRNKLVFALRRPS